MKRFTVIILTILAFCFIFSFKIVGPINSSMLIGVLFLMISVKKRSLLRILSDVLKLAYSIGLMKFLYTLFLLSILFPILHQTYDYYFAQVILVLLIQFFLGCALWSIYKYYNRNGDYDIEKIIVYAFVVQSVIQCVVSFTPALQPFIFYFNNAESINESYNQLFGVGVRGVALASGTGFSLSLGYGVVYIIYVRKYLVTKLSFINISIGVALFIGIFFAGRTGFVGVIIAFIYYCLDERSGVFVVKVKNFIKLLFYFCVICFIVYIVFTDFVNHLVDNVFPFAFEPLYNLFNNSSFETSSTNRLQEMWEVPVTWNELLFGTGYYFDPLKPDTYYKQVDIGLYKNIFFWGLWGYFLVFIFQYKQLYPLRFKLTQSEWCYFGAIFLFLFLLDLKAIALGLNKTVFSILLLISFYYEQNITNNTFHTK